MRRAAAIAAWIVVALWVIVPFYLLALAAFTAQANASDYPKSFLPSSPTTSSLAAFGDSPGVMAATVNSLVAALVAIAVALAAGLPAAYLASRSGAAFGLARAGRTFPIAMLAVPLAVLLARAGVIDNVVSVGIVHAALALPFVVLVLGRVGPGPRSVGAAAGVAFLISWNEVFAASALTLQMRTLPAQIFASLATSPLAFKLAGAFVLIVPSVVVFLLIRRSLVRVWS